MNHHRMIWCLQLKVLGMKSTAKYEKKIQDLNSQCQLKADECYQAWMSLASANDQLEKVRMELDNKLFQTYSLGKMCLILIILFHFNFSSILYIIGDSCSCFPR